MQRLDLDVEGWVGNIAHYGSPFHRLAGTIQRLRDWARITKRAWLHGHRGARRLYTKAAQAT